MASESQNYLSFISLRESKLTPADIQSIPTSGPPFHLHIANLPTRHPPRSGRYLAAF
jgi:hypothetical protein